MVSSLICSLWFPWQLLYGCRVTETEKIHTRQDQRATSGTSLTRHLGCSDRATSHFFKSGASEQYWSSICPDSRPIARMCLGEWKMQVLTQPLITRPVYLPSGDGDGAKSRAVTGWQSSRGGAITDHPPPQSPLPPSHPPCFHSNTWCVVINGHLAQKVVI